MRYLNLFNCWGFYYEKDLSWIDLMWFTLTSFIVISSLLFYYKKISRNGKKDQLDTPIYNSKDVFSQEIIGDSNFALAEKSTSIFAKITAYILVAILVTSSMSKLLTNSVVDYTY